MRKTIMWAIIRNCKLSTTKLWGDRKHFTPDIYSTKKMAVQEIKSWLDQNDYSVVKCEIKLLN